MSTAQEQTRIALEEVEWFKRSVEAIGVQICGLPGSEESSAFEEAWPRIASECFAKLIRLESEHLRQIIARGELHLTPN